MTPPSFAEENGNRIKVKSQRNAKNVTLKFRDMCFQGYERHLPSFKLPLGDELARAYSTFHIWKDNSDMAN